MTETFIVVMRCRASVYIKDLIPWDDPHISMGAIWYTTVCNYNQCWVTVALQSCSLNTGRCDPHGSECRTKNLLGVQSTFGLGRCGKPRLGKVDEVSLEGTEKTQCLGLKKRESLNLLFWGHLWGDWLVPRECSWNYQKQHQWAFRTKCLLNQRKGMSTE